MYSTCLFCARDLGANDVIETLPIGRRVAFDSATGRLWVVCRKCDQWNLVPFDTRLETIETCEELFRGTSRRFSTDNIGIAKLTDGLELVRIGKPRREEFASWRYGDRFRRRRTRALVVLPALSVLSFGMAFGVTYAAESTGIVVGSGIGSVLAFNAGQAVVGWYRNRRVAATMPADDGSRPVTTFGQMEQATVATTKSGAAILTIPTYERQIGGLGRGLVAQPRTYRDEQILPLLGQILPHINRYEGTTSSVREAMDLTASAPDWTSLLRERKKRRTARKGVAYRLDSVAAEARLAIEMLSHETTERTALAGELKLLERQWEDADRIAKIADGLVTGES